MSEPEIWQPMDELGEDSNNSFQFSFVLQIFKLFFFLVVQDRVHFQSLKSFQLFLLAFERGIRNRKQYI